MIPVDNYIFSRSLFCCARPTVERDLSPPSVELELQVRILTSIGCNKSPVIISGSEPGEDCFCVQKVWQEWWRSDWLGGISASEMARRQDTLDTSNIILGLVYCGPGAAEENIWPLWYCKISISVLSSGTLSADRSSIISDILLEWRSGDQLGGVPVHSRTYKKGSRMSSNLNIRHCSSYSLSFSRNIYWLYQIVRYMVSSYIVQALLNILIWLAALRNFSRLKIYIRKCRKIIYKSIPTFQTYICHIQEFFFLSIIILNLSQRKSWS